MEKGRKRREDPKVNLVDRDDDEDKRELRERYGSVAPTRCRKLTPGERSPLPLAGVRERRLLARAMLPWPRPSLRQAPRRPAAEARARFLPLVSCRAVWRRRFRRLPRGDGGQRGDERLLRLAQSVRGALEMMHRNMAERTQHTPLPPPCGEVRRRFLAASGWGSLRCATALLFERDAPTPASRVPRAAGSPRKGEVFSWNQSLPCTFYRQRSDN